MDSPTVSRWRRWIAFAVLTAAWCGVAVYDRYAIHRPIVLENARIIPPIAVAIALGLRWFGAWIGRAKLWRLALAAPAFWFGAAFVVGVLCASMAILEGQVQDLPGQALEILITFPIGIATFPLVMFPHVVAGGVLLTLAVTRWAYSPKARTAPRPAAA
jgi:hypothetical protein